MQLVAEMTATLMVSQQPKLNHPTPQIFPPVKETLYHNLSSSSTWQWGHPHPSKRTPSETLCMLLCCWMSHWSQRPSYWRRLKPRRPISLTRRKMARHSATSACVEQFQTRLALSRHFQNPRIELECRLAILVVFLLDTRRRLREKGQCREVLPQGRLTARHERSIYPH